MKRYRLLSTPLPHDDESPASILIRAAEGNGYENVHQMVSVTKLNTNENYLDLLVKNLDRFLKLATSLYLTCTKPEEVLERSGPTILSLRRFLLHFFPLNLFRQDGTAFCRACLHEKPYLRKLWIFKPYATCHIHNLPILTNCPHCSAEMKISRGLIRVCSLCKCDITLEPNQVTPNTISTWVKHFVSENDQHTEEFIGIFSWAKTIVGPHEKPQDDNAAAAISYQYFNDRENFQQYLVDFISYDRRHPRLKLLPLLSSCDSLSEIATALLDQLYRDAPFSDDDLSTQLSMTEISTFLSVCQATVGKLLKRNKMRPLPREATMSLSDLLSALDIDAKRKSAIKDQQKSELLTINQVAEQLFVHPEIVRSVRKAGYICFKRTTVAGSLKYLTTKESMGDFCSKYVLVGTLAKRLGVNSTDLTAKLAAIDIHPIATPKNSELKTCIFNTKDVHNITRDMILAIESYRTNAGRKRKDSFIDSPVIDTTNINIVEAANQLDISVQQAKTLIQKNILKRTQDFRIGVFVSKSSIKNLHYFLKSSDYISLDLAARELQCNKTQLKREWISTGIVEYKNLVYWELVKVSDIKKIKEIKADYVNGAEVGEILGTHRTHAANLCKRGLLERHYFDTKNKVPLYKRSDILLFKSS